MFCSSIRYRNNCEIKLEKRNLYDYLKGRDEVNECNIRLASNSNAKLPKMTDLHYPLLLKFRL